MCFVLTKRYVNETHSIFPLDADADEALKDNLGSLSFGAHYHDTRSAYTRGSHRVKIKLRYSLLI
jgi:hypothetical protein